jgi:hypothetical protein
MVKTAHRQLHQVEPTFLPAVETSHNSSHTAHHVLRLLWTVSGAENRRSAICVCTPLPSVSDGVLALFV